MRRRQSPDPELSDLGPVRGRRRGDVDETLLKLFESEVLISVNLI